MPDPREGRSGESDRVRANLDRGLAPNVAEARALLAERDRYRTALEQIAAAPGPLIQADPASLGHGFEQIAKVALDA